MNRVQVPQLLQPSEYLKYHNLYSVQGSAEHISSLISTCKKLKSYREKTSGTFLLPTKSLKGFGLRVFARTPSKVVILSHQLKFRVGTWRDKIDVGNWQHTEKNRCMTLIVYHCILKYSLPLIEYTLVYI